MNEEALIDAMSEYRYLWDQKDVNYSNRNMRTQAYEEIAKELGEDISGYYYFIALPIHKGFHSSHIFPITIIIGDEVKNKWHSLRTSFVRNYIETTKHKSGDSGESHFSPKWRHYQRMLFLRDTMKSDPSFSNLNIMEQTLSGDSQSTIEQSDEELTVYPNSESPLDESLTQTPKSSKKRLKKSESNERNHLLDIASKLLTEPEDVDMLWAKSLALKLKRFPVHQREVIKYDIDGVVLRASNANMLDSP
jgi:hypothetical protein